MNLIVAVDEKWGIRCGTTIAFASIPGDIRYFKERKATDGVIVMGHQEP